MDFKKVSLFSIISQIYRNYSCQHLATHNWATNTPAKEAFHLQDLELQTIILHTISKEGT